MGFKPLQAMSSVTKPRRRPNFAPLGDCALPAAAAPMGAPAPAPGPPAATPGLPQMSAPSDFVRATAAAAALTASLSAAPTPVPTTYGDAKRSWRSDECERGCRTV